MLMLKYMYQMTSSSQFYVVSYYHYFSKISLQGRIAKVCVRVFACVCLGCIAKYIVVAVRGLNYCERMVAGCHKTPLQTQPAWCDSTTAFEHALPQLCKSTLLACTCSLCWYTYTGCMWECVYVCVCVSLAKVVRAPACKSKGCRFKSLCRYFVVAVFSLSKKLNLHCRSLHRCLNGNLVAWCQLGKQPTQL